MKEIVGNIWDYYDKGHWICVTTNGNIKKNGEAVMGKGLALEATKKVPEFSGHSLQYWLGTRISVYSNDPFKGNRLNSFSEVKVFCFPTKWNWWDKSDLCLIAVSAFELWEYVENAYIHIEAPIYLPRVGCGNGGLKWEEVKVILEKYLDDRFVVVHNE